MAEIRCPMCGKPNPEHLETCQFCQARIKPLIASPPAEESPPATPTPEAPPASPDEPGDWLAEMRGEGDIVDTDELDEEAEASAALPGGELPDWLDRQVSSPPAEEAPQAEEELPDWLQPSPEEAGEETSPAVETREVGPPEALSDWQPGLEEEALPSQPPQEPSETEGEEALPEWLTKPLVEVPEESVQADEGEELPDWLREEMAEKGEEQPEIAAEDELRQWLESSVPEGKEAPPETPGMVAAFEEEDELPLSEEEIGELPDWLTELSTQAPSIPLEPEDSEMLESEIAEWALDEHPSAFTAPEPGEEALEDLPDWLPGGDRELDLADLEEIAEEHPSVDLEPGELPDWLKAMRPEEGAPPSQIVASQPAEGEVERVGPLAGLHDILRAEPEITKAGTPRTYSVKLHLTPRQQNNVKLLRSLVETEDQPTPLPPTTRLTPQRLLRWIIAFGLLVAVALPLLAQSTLVSMPDLMPPESVAVNQAINDLENDAPVLLAFDYEPGLSGELDAVAATVIDHLMLQGARLTLISTSPIGPAQAERFMRKLQREVQLRTGLEHNYTPGEKYINLGYISGGITGLLNFAIAPQQTVSVAFDDRPVWELLNAESPNPWDSPALRGVNTLADFALVLVITDDPDTARSWVEQVQPALKADSLGMIISAQAEPLVRPYYQGAQSQVHGMVTGLFGGATYEQRQGRPLLARTYWDAFGISILMALMLILVGGLYNLEQGLAATSKEHPRGKPS